MDAYALSRSVKDSLEAVGSSKATVATALEPWARIAAFDAVHDKIRKPGQVAFASAGKKIAKEASESLAGAEQAAQLARGAAVAGYFDTALRDCHQWQLRDYTKKLAQFIKSLPDAPAEVRDEITATTNTVSARIAYLAKELDFDDTAFWASIRD